MKKIVRAGRPKMPDEKKRTRRVDVFFTQAERDALGQSASSHGRTLSEHIRKAVTGQS